MVGNKGVSHHGYDKTYTGPPLEQQIAKLTQVAHEILEDYEASSGCSVDKRLECMNGRTTSREEDLSYALYGIFGVTPGANYGDRADGARRRLLAAIKEREGVAALEEENRSEIMDWLVPSDPSTTHESARQRHESGTGAWLLQSEQYQNWKSGPIGHLWIHGKPGCGKTILCSTAIEDVSKHCRGSENVAQALFYFSFSDSTKRTYESCLRSLLVQLGKNEPGLSILHRAYMRSRQRLPGINALESILRSCIESYTEVFLHLDAFDECTEDNDERQNVLDSIAKLLQDTSNVRLLATSRDVPDVHSCMEKLLAERLFITPETIDKDIRKYVSTQISRDRNLSGLDPATRTLIKETFAEKADGM